MIYVLIIIIVLSLLYNLITRLKTQTLDTKMYKLGTGEEGSDYDIVGQFIEENCGNISRIPQEFSDGGFNNLIKVNRGKLDFCICQDRFFQNGVNNLLEFKTFNKLENVQFVSSVYIESMNFIVKDYDTDEQGNASMIDSDIVIDSMEDLATKNNIIIGVGETLSASQNNFEVICSDNGLVIVDYLKRNDEIFKNIPENRKVYYLNGTLNQLFNKFYKGEIHGIFMMASANNVYIKNISRRMNVKFIDFYNEKSKLVTNFNNYYFKKSINTGNYFSKPKKQQIIPTFASRIVLCVNKNVPKNVVTNITKCIYEKYYTLRKMLNPNITRANLDEYEPLELAYALPDYSVHPGADEYYLSKNLVSSDEKFKYDLDFYAKSAYKNYWKYLEIGDKNFDYSILLEENTENEENKENDTICFN